MDKTSLDSYKAEERETSCRLYRKLALLQIVHHPTKEFLEVFKTDMFTKPNDKAFFQVFYYLFNIFDADAVRKRFYWPITDKKYEAMFRTATVSYINYLIDKYNIKWQPMKSYLVVKPGGMKFLTFIHDLIDFLIKELIKRNEKHINIEKRPETFDLETITVKSRILKAYAGKYASEIDIQKDIIENFTTHLNRAFTKLYALTGLSERVLCDSAFHKYFDDFNISVCQNKMENTSKMGDWLQKLELLNATVNEFLTSKNSTNDVKMTEDILVDMKMLFPEIEFTKNNSSDLITAYNQVFSFIIQSHDNVIEHPREMVDYESSELQRIRSETIQLETELCKFTSEHENLQAQGTTIAFDTPKRSTTDGTQNVLQVKI